jgi:hypothetical protein
MVITLRRFALACLVARGLYHLEGHVRPWTEDHHRLQRAAEPIADVQDVEDCLAYRSDVTGNGFVVTCARFSRFR